MLEFDVNKSPGLGAFFAGQNQTDKLNNSAMARALQDAQRQSTLGTLQMAQAEHPLKLQRMGLENTGLDLGNTQTRGKITDAETERRQKATDNFFKYLEEKDDPEGAFVYSGVPRNEKFMQLAQLPKEERAKLYKKWQDSRMADTERKERLQSQLKREEQAANNADVYRREQLKQDEAMRRAQLQYATQSKIAEIKAKAQEAVKKNPSITQHIGGLLARLEYLGSMEAAGMNPEVKKFEMDRIEQEINSATRAAAAMNPARPQVDVGAASGGQVPMITPQPPFPQRPTQSAEPPKSITYQGKQYEVLGTNPDGSTKIKDPQTGRTGTLRQ
jgi:hypothetical protein